MTTFADSSSAIIKDGIITNQKNAKQKEEKIKNSASEQKEQFLQLLVAQMKYQDPLQPTSNTEYISQYATFSSLEQMQNMASTLSMSRANDIIGKQVIIHHKSDTESTQEVEGIVDYAVYENNKAKISVNNSLYDIDEVYMVLSNAYTTDTEEAKTFVDEINKLPNIKNITKEDAKNIENLANKFDFFKDSIKKVIDEKAVSKLMEYVLKCKELNFINQNEKVGVL